MTPAPLMLEPGQLTLAQLRAMYRTHQPVQLTDSARPAILASQQTVSTIVAGGDTVYGINTGFGRLAQTHIPQHQLAQLQRNLVLSHAVGTGDLLDDACVRLALLLKINSLARGYSGVSPELIDTLIALFNQEIYPCIPGQGSVGASGDLAPLAHLSLVLLGEGEVHWRGQRLPAAQALAQAGIEPLTLQAKEGLAVLNGTQVSTALALAGLFEAERNFEAAILAGAMSVEAALGSFVPFDPRIHAIRGQSGQQRVAALFRRILDSSEINRSHEGCEKVQDPYSLRCQPQVMGACLDQIEYAASRILCEANAVSDNPLVFSETGDAISGGNFHAEPIAFAADNLALAIAEIGALSERRIAMLIDSSISQLPPFLIAEPGLNSGFMIAHVTAAALASENKSLAHPASVDSLPTSANQEDHVSMATFAARRLGAMNANTQGVIAIELLAAAQGIDCRRPLRSTAIIEQAHALIRRGVATLEQDRFFAPDIAYARSVIGGGAFEPLIPHEWTAVTA
ncbi:MAG: histidine ammonia-lyase [Candidatus Competibacteraceae bacterium]|nr:histidine ammonia-lyase [Candidatus Competibacteraceae bacterium]MCB1813362.1 histidine ammonia-lyase [Candidatus Competibacteraceae bacterium]